MKQSNLWDFVKVHNLDTLVISETWWTEKMSCSLFGEFKSIARSDRQNGPRGCVAILSRLTCNNNTEKIISDDFDFAAAAVIQLSGDSTLLIILVHLLYPSHYEVSFDVMERLIDSIFSSFREQTLELNTLTLFGSSEISTFRQLIGI